MAFNVSDGVKVTGIFDDPAIRSQPSPLNTSPYFSRIVSSAAVYFISLIAAAALRLSKKFGFRPDVEVSPNPLS